MEITQRYCVLGFVTEGFIYEKLQLSSDYCNFTFSFSMKVYSIMLLQIRHVGWYKTYNIFNKEKFLYHFLLKVLALRALKLIIEA